MFYPRSQRPQSFPAYGQTELPPTRARPPISNAWHYAWILSFTMMAAIILSMPFRFQQRQERRHHIMCLQLLLFISCLSVNSCSAFAFAPSTNCRRIPQRTLPWRPLHLFSVKTNDNEQKPKKPQDEKDDEELDEVDDDFSWIKGLSRWPLTPSPPTEQDENTGIEKDPTDSRGGFIPIPLANLINVEAILMMNGEKTLDSTQDLEMYTTTGVLSNETTSTLALLNVTNTTSSTTEDGSSPLAILPDLEELANWEELAKNIRQSVADAGSGTSQAIGGKTDALLKEASSRIEYFVTEASTAISPNAVKDLVQRAGRALASQGEGDLVQVAAKLAREQGLNVSEAAERAKQTTEYTTNLVQIANGLLQNGYARGDKVKEKSSDTADTVVETKDDSNKALFSDFETAKIVSPSLQKSFVAKAAELGSICGAIYQETVPRTLGLGHSIVANSTTQDVSWMVTDCIATRNDFEEQESSPSFRRRDDNEKDGSKPMLVRTITIRGFDASDESIDRELLLNRICTANPEALENGVICHSGLVDIARAIYKDIKPYIDLTAPEHGLVLTGHSVGGSLSVLMLLLMVEDYGVDFVRNKVLRVFTFGSPPVVTLAGGVYNAEQDDDYLGSIDGVPETDPYECDILKAYGLQSSMVYGFVQPWDPIVRLFSEIDPLYPLLGDMGEDGVTVYASGPPRTLRPITRAIFEAWDGWPLFRDTFRATVNQNYTSVGVQHILLPDSVRYLSDRFVAANINVPPVEHILRISSNELLPGLDKNFPLDTFRISFVPAAIRGFIHHFYPAYGFPVVDFANKKLKRQAVSKKVNDGEKEDYRIVLDQAEDTLLDISGARSKSSNGKRQKKEDRKSGSKGGWTAPGWLQNSRKEAD